MSAGVISLEKIEVIDQDAANPSFANAAMREQM